MTLSATADVHFVYNYQCINYYSLQGQIQILCFSPNGHYLASGGADARVLIWELRHGHLVAELTEHTDTVYALAFCRDGSVLASGWFMSLPM